MKTISERLGKAAATPQPWRFETWFEAITAKFELCPGEVVKVGFPANQLKKEQFAVIDGWLEENEVWAWWSTRMNPDRFYEFYLTTAQPKETYPHSRRVAIDRG